MVENARESSEAPLRIRTDLSGAPLYLAVVTELQIYGGISSIAYEMPAKDSPNREINVDITGRDARLVPLVVNFVDSMKEQFSDYPNFDEKRKQFIFSIVFMLKNQ